MATLEDYFFTKNTKWILWGLALLVLAALIFHAGVVVGSHSRGLERGPGMPGSTFKARLPFGASVELPRGFMPSGHGALGDIESVSLPYFTMLTRDGSTLRIVVGSSTQINGAGGGTAALTEGRTVIVIGNPGDIDDEIEAKLIRIVDDLPAEAGQVQGGSIMYAVPADGSMPPMPGNTWGMQQ